MSFFKDKRKRKLFIITSSVLFTLAIIIGTCAIYLGDYYHADECAIAVFNADENITVSVLDNGNIIFTPQNATPILVCTAHRTATVRLRFQTENKYD